MPEAVIVDSLRTAVGKAPRGTLRNSLPDDLAATVLRRLLDIPGPDEDEIGDRENRRSVRGAPRSVCALLRMGGNVAT
jgi:acetyl-CoA acetyltransferase